MSNNGGNLTVQYNLRWTEEMRDKIAKEAKINTRSMNQEIISRLQDSLRTFPSLYLEKGLEHVSTEDLLSELMRRYDDSELVLNLTRKKFQD